MTQPVTETTTSRLTESLVRDLVDQLAAAVGVVRPAVAFLPWLDDDTAVVHTVYQPGRRAEPARIDLARPALDHLSPAAWRHLLAHEIGHLKLHHSRAVSFVEGTLEVIGGAFALAAIAWFALRSQSLGVLAAGLGVAVFTVMAQYAWQLRCELRADRYAARITGLNHATVDEIWNHLEQRAGMTLGERYRRHRLHHLVDQADNHPADAQEHTPPGPRHTHTEGRAPTPSAAAVIEDQQATDGPPDHSASTGSTTRFSTALIEEVNAKINARIEAEWAERGRVTHVDTNPFHGDRSFTINLSSDGYCSVTFSHIPGGADANVIVVDSHPRYSRVNLTAEDIDRVLVQLVDLATGLDPTLNGRTVSR